MRSARMKDHVHNDNQRKPATPRPSSAPACLLLLEFFALASCLSALRLDLRRTRWTHWYPHAWDHASVCSLLPFLFSRVQSHALPLSLTLIQSLSFLVLFSPKKNFLSWWPAFHTAMLGTPRFTFAIYVMLAQASISRIWMERKHYLQVP